MTFIPQAWLAGLDPAVFLGLLAASFAGSFITVALGIGGGILVLAVMASLMPPAVLIPIHGIIQVGSNLGRAVLLLRYMHWPPAAGFTIGSMIGVGLGGMVVVELPPAAIQIGIGLFVIWSILRRPPAWLTRWPMLTGGLSSFLTMFFGASGVFVANFVKSLNLPRQSHVATHAGLMTVQHGLKVLAFGMLGFAFADWVPFIVMMILAGLVGTLAGGCVLARISDTNFKTALNILLVLISIRLIWSGLSQLF